MLKWLGRCAPILLYANTSASQTVWSSPIGNCKTWTKWFNIDNLRKSFSHCVYEKREKLAEKTFTSWQPQCSKCGTFLVSRKGTISNVLLFSSWRHECLTSWPMKVLWNQAKVTLKALVYMTIAFFLDIIQYCWHFRIAYHLYYCYLKIFIEPSRTQPD